jgi:hypothetical protein
MRQNNLSPVTPRLRLNTRRMIRRKRTNMRRQPRHIRRIHTPQSSCRADDALPIRNREPGASDDEGSKDHARIWGEGADLGEAALGERKLYPGVRQDGDHHGLGLCILWEIDGVGDDVGDSLDGDGSVESGLADFSSITLHNRGHLGTARVSKNKARF